MQQRNSTIGRPSGTDGSDHSYRMVIESRYQQVAEAKKQLPVLLSVQALLLLVAAIFATLPGTKEDTPDKVALGSVVGGLIALIIAEFGRRQSRAFFLRLCRATDFLPVLLAMVLGRRHSVEKVFEFESRDFPVLQACLLVYLGILFGSRLYTTMTVTSLISNMSPLKKAKGS